MALPVVSGEVVAGVVGPLFRHFPRRWGRQPRHDVPALAQEQFLQRPERLHLQQDMARSGTQLQLFKGSSSRQGTEQLAKNVSTLRKYVRTLRT